MQKRGHFLPPPSPPAPSLHAFFHQGGPALPTACNLQVEANFQPPATNCSSFSDIKALPKCDFFDLFSLMGHHSPPPPSPRRHVTFTSSPVSFLLALFVFCAHGIHHRCSPPSLPVPLFGGLPSPYHSSHSSHSSSFPLRLILVAPQQAFSCIINFDNLYTERRACCVRVSAIVCAFCVRFVCVSRHHLLEAFWLVRSQEQLIARFKFSKNLFHSTF